jgi:hypothetical protein
MAFGFECEHDAGVLKAFGQMLSHLDDSGVLCARPVTVEIGFTFHGIDQQQTGLIEQCPDLCIAREAGTTKSGDATDS